MAFQTPNIPPTRAVPVGAVVSFCTVLATVALLAAIALQGVGLVDWGMQ